MTNQEAYNNDLDALRAAIKSLLAAVPIVSKSSDPLRRADAEWTASSALALINCMRNDYLILDI